MTIKNNKGFARIGVPIAVIIYVAGLAVSGVSAWAYMERGDFKEEIAEVRANAKEMSAKLDESKNTKEGHDKDVLRIIEAHNADIKRQNDKHEELKGIIKDNHEELKEMFKERR